MRYVWLLILIALFVPRVEASEGYCSLNDGIKVDGTTILEHQGKKHHFCCTGCLDQFKADPDKFAQEIQRPELTNLKDAEAACSTVCSE